LQGLKFFSAKNPRRIPPAFIPQTPFCGRNPNPKPRRIPKILVSVLRKSISPKNSFRKTESELKPHALPEYLEGRTPKEKHPFLFQEKIHPRQIKKARSVFLSGLLAYSPVRGASVHSSSFRSKKVRAKCIITAQKCQNKNCPTKILFGIPSLLT